MRRPGWHAGIALIGLLLLVVGLPASAVAQAQTLTVTMNPQNNSGVTGTATFTDLGGGHTRVALQVSGAGAGPQPAHIHPGTCASLDPTPAFVLTSVTNGSSTTDVNTSFQQLIDGQFAIHLHKSNDELTTYVSCADIIQSGQPRNLPNTGDLGTDWAAAVAILTGIGLVVVGLGVRRLRAG
jgi:LPXTG-motif cell wall-anchored protein